MNILDLWNLYRGTISNVNRFLEGEIEEYGISHGQFEYFMIISEHPGLTQNEIATKKNVGKTAVTKAIKLLLDSGLIERRVDPKDKRSFFLYCSEKGEAVSEIFKGYKEIVSQQIISGIDEDELEILVKLLKKMYENSLHIEM